MHPICLFTAGLFLLLAQSIGAGQASGRPATTDGDTLHSADWSVLIQPKLSMLFVGGGAPVAYVKSPLAADVIDGNGKISHATGFYTSFEPDGTALLAKGFITCPGGSILNFIDRFSCVADGGGFALAREITVAKAGATDTGFRTEFEIHSDRETEITGVQPFLPGIWYCDASHVPASMVITDPHLHEYLFREDRLPIPMAMLREKASGVCISIVHSKPDGATFAGEFSPAVVTDERMKFGSLGFRQSDGMSVVFSYPGQ